MKFAIVLLALVACTAALPQERGVIQDVQNMVSGAITKAQNDLASLGNLVQGLVSNAQAQVAAVIAGAKSNVYAKIDELENTIAAMIVKGGAVAFCAQANIAPLTELRSNFGKNVENCIGGLATTLNSFETSIFNEIASLSASIAELVNLVQDCTSNILDVAVCAFTKYREVQSLISNIIGGAADAVNITRTKVSVTVSQIQSCAQLTIGEATTTLNQFVSAVQQCA